MSQNTEAVPFRTKLKVSISNFLQKYRTLLVILVVAVVAVVAVLAIWTQFDASNKVTFGAKIEKSESDFALWQTEADASKKAELAKTLEAELAEIQKSAPNGYGLSKAWFVQGNYEVVLKNWSEASKAYRTVYDKDKSSYLAPIALVNAAVALEEAGDAALREGFQRGRLACSPGVFHRGSVARRSAEDRRSGEGLQEAAREVPGGRLDKARSRPYTAVG
jgi:tetratricopeptide (TPR) repeat protein